MTGFAPYNTVLVRPSGGGNGFQASLPAKPIRQRDIRELDRYFYPGDPPAFVLVPAGEDIPLVPRDQAEPTS